MVRESPPETTAMTTCSLKAVGLCVVVVVDGLVGDDWEEEDEVDVDTDVEVVDSVDVVMVGSLDDSVVVVVDKVDGTVVAVVEGVDGSVVDDAVVDTDAGNVDDKETVVVVDKDVWNKGVVLCNV